MSLPRVLIADDDEKIAAVLSDYLKAAGFDVAAVGDGLAAVEYVRDQHPACVLLDLNMPKLEGLEACKQIRTFSQVPIAMVTARVDEIDRLLGLELGADDYICKPFSPREVVARVKALVRRASIGQSAPVPSTLLELDAEALKASIRGKVLALTAVEFRLLAALAAQPGRVFSRDQLLDAAHSKWHDAGDRTIDSHVRNLRKKIETAAPGFDPIRSVYGVGYSWEPAEGA
jgi:two-component system response regulator BaeR